MKYTFAVLAFTLGLSGCGGGASHIPQSGIGVPIPASGTSLQSVNASATISTNNLPANLQNTAQAAKRRTLSQLRAQGLNIAQVKATGTLYQSTTSAITITNSQLLTPQSGTVTVTLTFSNVIPTNNDWIIFDFTAIASDGSQFDLGELGTVIDVASNSTTTVNLDANSTRRLQVLLNLATSGFVSTYDFENTANLDALIGSAIGSTSYDSTTQLFNATTLASLTSSIQPQFARSITVNTGATSPAIVSIAADY